MKLLKSLVVLGFCFVPILSSYAAEAMLQQKIGAYKVMTSQIAMSAKTKISYRQREAEGEMAGLALLSSLTEQYLLYRDFGPTTGQGAMVCDAANQRSDISRIMKEVEAYDFGNTERGGSAKIPIDKYVVMRTQQRLEDYCSGDMHNLGLCRSKFDGMASADTNYAVLAQTEHFTNKQAKAAQDFISNVVPNPPPLAPVISASCGPKCQEARSLAIQYNSYASLAATGLAAHFATKIGEKTYAPKKEVVKNAK